MTDKWDSALTDFKNYLQLERSFSGNTVEAYIRDLSKLKEYITLKQYPLAPADVDSSTLSELMVYLNSLGLERSSQARLLSSIKTFYKYLLIENLIVKDPTGLMASPKIHRKLPEVLTFEEIEAILTGIDLSAPNGTRNRAIVEVLYACGLRVSELTELRLTNIFTEIGFLKVIGKGNKERIIPVGEEALKYMQLYIRHVRNKISPQKGAENIVFLNNRGAALSRVMIFLMIKEMALQAGIDKTVSPHTFRHSFATHLLEGGADLKVIQDLLGHESITTTEIYTHLDAEYLKETVLAFHPRNIKARNP